MIRTHNPSPGIRIKDIFQDLGISQDISGYPRISQDSPRFMHSCINLTGTSNLIRKNRGSKCKGKGKGKALVVLFVVLELLTDLPLLAVSLVTVGVWLKQ